MKYLIYITAFLLFLVPTLTNAQYGPNSTYPSCEPIENDEQYSLCCDPSSLSYACEVYNIQRAPSQPTAPGQPGTLPGNTTGGPDTGAINIQQNQGFGFGTFGAPASGSAELASCSAIRFVSLLDILIWIKCVITSALLPLIFTLAFFFFLFGVFRFMMATDATRKEESKKFILWGLIGLFVMVSIWGIIRILGVTLGVDTAVPLLQTQYLDENKASRP